MPFTPFHMGVALTTTIKPVMQRHFSVITFGVVQIAMDIEPLTGLLTQTEVLHGPTHTFIGASVIGWMTAAIAPFIVSAWLRQRNQEVTLFQLQWLAEPVTPSWIVIHLSALFGTWSHVVLDSLMYQDTTPFAPFSPSNPFLNGLSYPLIEPLCSVLGLLGITAWLTMQWIQSHRKML